MSEWLDRNQKPVLYIIILLFLGLVSLYIYQVRPLQTEKATQQRELQLIHTEISNYEAQISQLRPQTLTLQDQKRLLNSVPSQPNVEQLVADLERTELETGVFIRNISTAISPNESGESLWSHIFSEDMLEILGPRVKDVDMLTVSYIELRVDVTGEEKDVHMFVEKIENLPRIIHLQDYTYDISVGENSVKTFNGTVTIRAFYSEDFAEYIETLNEFELDYTFDKEKLDQYIKQAEGNSDEIGETNGNTPNSPSESNESSTDVVTDNESVEKNHNNTIVGGTTGGSTSNGQAGGTTGGTSGGSTGNAVTKPGNVTLSPIYPKESYDKELGVSSIELYYLPSGYDKTVKEGDSVFYLVQTGAYNTDVYFSKQLLSLIDAGMFPRTVVRKYDPALSSLVINTGIAHTRESATAIGDFLYKIDREFNSWVEAVPFRLPTDEQKLLPEAIEAITYISDVAVKGITTNDYKLAEEQLLLIRSKVEAYEAEAKEVINNTKNADRKVQIQDTIIFLQLALQTLEKFEQTNEVQLLWQTQGAMLDFAYSLNGFVRFETK
ncbi:hypothetical protein [Halalkalibacter alkaliphilus]|uniref:Uncharacterized protein n=1 Tax=Halalkalibacter alkaliphilus TaxID=2917993 RepID=A0A9X2CU00_9BACI|nr:hypothetical protein [Halalkalibacter alkaliphilus]MCL7748100.1 hypothetical protein [Halalkalibacter alkaliphilus]